jgi:hypothetical protein
MQHLSAHHCAAPAAPLRALSRLAALAASLAAALVAAACATPPPPTTAMLTYETAPEGATLFEGGQSLGIAPVTRTYKPEGTSTSVRTPEVTAVWPSGAKASFFTLLPLGADRVATIDRPKNAPGLEADLENAKKVVADKEGAARRAKEALARDMARNSQRCKEQQQKGNLATNDC